jgi:putative ABC transport system ATP-binding protein
VALPLELDGRGIAASRRAAETALATVGLEDKGQRYPDELSGGEQQRVAIARGVVGPRRLLLADEPTGALDEVTAEGILRLLRSRCEEGAACMLVTHELSFAAWADRIVRLRDGQIETVTQRSAATTAAEVGA